MSYFEHGITVACCNCSTEADILVLTDDPEGEDIVHLVEGTIPEGWTIVIRHDWCNRLEATCGAKECNEE